MKKLITILGVSFLIAVQAQAGDDNTYRVTITNATTHQVLTPPLIAVHSRSFRVFNVGDSASQGLVTQAETGNPSELALELDNSQGVSHLVTGTDVIPYGQSISFDITAARKEQLTITSMLATTNDGFAAINGVDLPKRSATYYAYAYDAGSENNNESCAYVPGPPCTPGSGNARDETLNGFITIHNGIHGGSDLNPKHLDWRGPVAVVTVKRIND